MRANLARSCGIALLPHCRNKALFQSFQLPFEGRRRARFMQKFTRCNVMFNRCSQVGS
jgi:hypothetical protein